MCVDFRQYSDALSRIEQLLDNLRGFFFIFYMKYGYYQVKKEESRKELTAFTVGLLRFYELTSYHLDHQMLQREDNGGMPRRSSS